MALQPFPQMVLLPALLAVMLAAPPAGRTAVVVVDTGVLPREVSAPLGDGLEDEVRASRDWRLRERPAISLDEVVFSMGCASLDTACMQKIRGALRTDVMLLATVAPQRTAEVELWWVEARTATVVVRGPWANASGLVDATRQAVRTRLGPLHASRLRLLAEPPGASIAVDGRVVGASPVTVTGLPAGNHVVSAAAPGFEAMTSPLVLDDAEDRVITLNLQPIRTAPAPVVSSPPAPVDATPSSNGAARPGPRAAVTPATTRAPAPASRAWTTPVSAAVGLLAGLSGGVAALGLVLGALGLAAGGGAYALVWTVQVTRGPLRPVVMPASAAGALLVGAALVPALLSVTLAVVAVVVRAVL